MTYQNIELADKITSLEQEQDLLLHDSERQREVISKLTSKIPSTPYRISTILLNTLIGLGTGLILVVGVVFGYVLCLDQIHQYQYEEHKRVQEHTKVQAEERVQAEKVLHARRIASHPKVTTIQFNESVSAPSLQESSPGKYLSAQGSAQEQDLALPLPTKESSEGEDIIRSTKFFYAIRQPRSSFVEFDIQLTSKTNTSRATVEIFMYGESEALYRQRVGTKSYALYLPQGNYRFRLQRYAADDPTTANTITLHRLSRVEDTSLPH